MAKIFQQTYADLGVAADVNFMARPNWVQPSVSLIKITRVNWNLTEIAKIILKLKGNATPKEFTGSAITGVTAGAAFNPAGTHLEVKQFLDANVQGTGKIATDKSDIDTNATNFNSMTNTASDLGKFLKITNIEGDSNSFGIFAQGAATTDGSSNTNTNTMIESITLEINAANDNAMISNSTFTPITNFSEANTSRMGQEITL